MIEEPTQIDTEGNWHYPQFTANEVVFARMLAERRAILVRKWNDLRVRARETARLKWAWNKHGRHDLAGFDTNLSYAFWLQSALVDDPPPGATAVFRMLAISIRNLRRVRGSMHRSLGGIPAIFGCQSQLVPKLFTEKRLGT